MAVVFGGGEPRTGGGSGDTRPLAVFVSLCFFAPQGCLSRLLSHHSLLQHCNSLSFFSLRCHSLVLSFFTSLPHRLLQIALPHSSYPKFPAPSARRESVKMGRCRLSHLSPPPHPSCLTLTIVFQPLCPAHHCRLLKPLTFFLATSSFSHDPPRSKSLFPFPFLTSATYLPSTSPSPPTSQGD